MAKKSNKPSAVKVSVPATSANLGPGFDCLGIALNLMNDFRVEVKAQGEDEFIGTGTSAGVGAGPNLFTTSMDAVYRAAKRKRPPVLVRAHGRVPLARGLGSSATAIVGGVVAANALLGGRFAQEDLLQIATEVEGHPDNVAPALLGSLTASARTEEGVITHVYRPHRDWRVVLLIPSYELSTSKARRAIPKKIPHTDAVANLSRIPLLIDALVAGDANELRLVMGDRLHEPYRKKLIEGFNEIKAAALKAGAGGVYLSGAGPTIAALCLGEKAAKKVARAMAKASKKIDPKHETLVLRPRSRGAILRIL